MRHPQKGFTLIEILIVMTIIGVLLAIAIPELHRAHIRAMAGAVIADAKTIYTAFKQYQVDTSHYYGTINLSTFEPLRSNNQYGGTVQRLLVNAQADAFDSPDDLGTDQEFWIEMTLALDTDVRVVVADSNDAPLSGGVWLDGVFKFENGVLIPL